MKNGCHSIFLLAREAHKAKEELDVKSLHFLCDKLVHFMDNRETDGNKVDAQQVADSLVRLMPCIKMVNISYFIFISIQINNTHLYFSNLGILVYEEKRNFFQQAELSQVWKK